MVKIEYCAFHSPEDTIDELRGLASAYVALSVALQSARSRVPAIKANNCDIDCLNVAQRKKDLQTGVV